MTLHPTNVGCCQCKYLPIENSSKHIWNKGTPTEKKPPFKLEEGRSIRTLLQRSARVRDSALFNLAVDRKLRAGDLVELNVGDISHGRQPPHQAIVLRQKAQPPAPFEIPIRHVLYRPLFSGRKLGPIEVLQRCRPIPFSPLTQWTEPQKKDPATSACRKLFTESVSITAGCRRSSPATSSPAPRRRPMRFHVWNATRSSNGDRQKSTSSKALL